MKAKDIYESCSLYVAVDELCRFYFCFDKEGIRQVIKKKHYGGKSISKVELKNLDISKVPTNKDFALREILYDHLTDIFPRERWINFTLHKVEDFIIKGDDCSISGNLSYYVLNDLLKSSVYGLYKGPYYIDGDIVEEMEGEMEKFFPWLAYMHKVYVITPENTIRSMMVCEHRIEKRLFGSVYHAVNGKEQKVFTYFDDAKRNILSSINNKIYSLQQERQELEKQLEAQKD